MIRGIAWGMAVVLACSAGCGRRGVDPTAKVTGTITVRGKPAKGLLVTFFPERGRPGTGVTDRDGRFSLSTFSKDDGAVVGPHVVIVDEAYLDKPPPMTTTRLPSRAPNKYRDRAASPLKVTVKAGEKNDFTFDLQP